MSSGEFIAVQTGSLSDRTVRQIEKMISDRDLRPGDRLPTVQELSQRLGVSLSVVREAIASLRANGTILTRQGAGIFVAEQSPVENRGLFSGDLSQISSIVEILELRLAVEVEAAGLAAERHSLAQESRIYEAFQDIEIACTQGRTGEREDSRFHITIAEATNNRRFVDFLEQLGNAMIPRSELGSLSSGKPKQQDYLNQLQKEHLAILEAISSGDVEQARTAMRNHLSHSRDRYHRLIKSKTGSR
ncbi:FadR/GntR family transcriptional regulator [uncultured Cohaesibacter sp.]|uniref:FadR/GntR family transcriptional regulator n=1 Tax=uncultured Cohaesibacter sp. TaxID=1002546 RepID=UPI00292D0D0A|nr:FadR/GntR family transcriptional regulator [uncultured Cohaesibacter sp.]